VPPGDATVNKGKIKVRFWDEETQDGDRIQVLLNGQVVPGLVNLSLTNAGTVVEMELRPGKNVITVRALSTGSQGPCTSGIAIQADAIISGQAQTRTDDMQVGQESTLEIDYNPAR